MGTLLNRRRCMGGGSADEIIMTSTSNPEVMAICYAQGWAAHADYMTKSEAEAVTNIGTYFQNSGVTHFEELQYFTGLTSRLADSFMQNCTVSLLIIPPIPIISGYCFRNTNYYKIVLSEGWDQSLPWQSFYSCNATYIEFPSTASGMPNVCRPGLNYDKHVLLNGNTVKACNGQTYYSGGSRNRIFVYVPDNLVATYKATQSWIDNFNIDCILPASQYSVSAQT